MSSSPTLISGSRFLLFDSGIAIDQPLGPCKDLIDLCQLGRKCLVVDQVEFDPLPCPASRFALDGWLFSNASERHDARPRNRPAGIVARHPAPRPNDAVRDDKLMARRANIHLCVVENEVLEMDEFAADPHTGNGIKEVGPLGKAGPNLRSGDPLIKPGKRVLRGRYRPQEGLVVQFADFTSH
jgi:hypothetical protein